MERRLAAVLAADVVGYSRMMGADEMATLAAFSDLRHNIFEPAVNNHRGKVIKRMGDGWLVEFSSALNAVRCAISVQEDLSDHPTIKLRIGVHVGDIVHDDEGDIHGDGVNIAARLEAVAKPCGVAISDQAYNSLDGTMMPAFADSGEHELKNIVRRVRIWSWPNTSPKSKSPTGAAENTVPVILLEPFSQGGDADAAADLALELQSGLLDALSNRSGVRVVTMEQGGVSPSYILKGRCRVSGNRCRLHLSITVAETGEINWTTKIDGTIDDMFDFVDDVVGQVGGVIRVHLNAVAGEAYASKPDNTLNVQQLLAKAAYYFHFFDRKSSDLSRETMAAAVEKAPEDPMVLAMQAYALMQTVPLAIERVEDVDVDEVMSFADRSAYHGPNVDFVFHQRARIRLWLSHDHEGCIKDANRSLAINPDYHLAKEDLALVDIFGGDIDRGLADLERIVEQFPTQPITPYRLSILGLGYVVTGDMATAFTRALDGFERKPLVPLHALVYAVAASEKQDVTGSSEFRKMIEQHGLTVSDAHRFPFKRSQDTAKIVGLLRKAGLPE